MLDWVEENWCNILNIVWNSNLFVLSFECTVCTAASVSLFFVRILLYNSTLIMLNLGRIQTTDFIWIKFVFTQGPSWSPSSWSSSSCSLTRCWSGLKLVCNLVMWTNLFRIKFVCIMQLDLGHFDRIKLLLIKVLIWRWPYSVVDKILKCFYYLKKEK